MFLIPAVAVSYFVIHATEMEGGTGEELVTSHLLQRGLIPGGVTVLKNTRGVVARIRWRASCSRDDSRWYSATSNTREGSSNPERGTGGSWDDSRWCSVKDKSVYTRSPFLLFRTKDLPSFINNRLSSRSSECTAARFKYPANRPGGVGRYSLPLRAVSSPLHSPLSSQPEWTCVA